MSGGVINCDDDCRCLLRLSVSEKSFDICLGHRALRFLAWLENGRNELLATRRYEDDWELVHIREHVNV